MTEEIIIKKSKKINDYLHFFDLGRNSLSGYIGEFDDCSLCMDVGSSFQVKDVLRYAKKNNIPLSSFKYFIPSHHHYDHNGGLWKIIDIIKEHNSEVKILTNSLTKDFLNNYENHITRAKKAYGRMVGEMHAIEDNNFKIINISEDPDNLKIIETFMVNECEIELAILKTPGHVPDHECSIFIKDGEVDFIFLGEAAGFLQHSTKLLTLPVSAPPLYSFKNDMETIKKLKKLKASKVGFAHYGVVVGKDNVEEILTDHEILMKEFRARIIEYHEEKDDTRYICEKVAPFLLSRNNIFTDGSQMSEIALYTVLQGVYGVMIDLGYRDG